MSVKNSKIEELYSHFSKSEREGITEFIHCQLFNTSDVICKIHEFFCALGPEEEVDKVALYRYVYGGKSSYSDVKLRVYLTKLTKLIEKYIIVKQLNDYPYAELNLLTSYYSANHLHKNTTVFFNNKPVTHFESYEEYLFYEYQYALRKLDFINLEYANDGDKMKEQFEIVMNSQKVLSQFQTLKSLCDFSSLTQKYKLTRDNTYEYGLIENLKNSTSDLDDIFKAYLIVFGLFVGNDREKFYELKEIVLNSQQIKYEKNVRALLAHFQNFCVRYINSGESDYLVDLLDSYKFSLRYYKNSGDLDSVNCRNIVYCALQLNEIQWAESFVESYAKTVSETDKGNAYNFNLARICFEKKDYKGAMRLLLRVTYEDSFYASSARILLIKCYYELNDEMPLVSCCASLNQFLRRSKDFTKQRVENNLHFIQFVKTLQNNRLKNSKTLFRNILSKIDTSTVVEKDWLKQKIHEISSQTIGRG
jgi:hypothetical protein